MMKLYCLLVGKKRGAGYTYSMMKALRSIACLVALAAFISACSNTKHLPDGDTLFRGSKINIKDRGASKKERKVLKTDLAGLVRPKPNSKTLGWRLKLSLYNLAGDSKKKKGIKQWLRNKVGEPPVLGSSVKLDLNTSLMMNLLQNRGFFLAGGTARWDTFRKKKTTAVFDIVTGPQYTIDSVTFRKDSTEISKDLDSDFAQTLLKPGAPYNLDLIKAERNRIDRMLKEKGFFYFRPEYILILVDSNIGAHKVNMYVKLKHREIPPEAYRVYNINDVYVYAHYRLHGEEHDTDKYEVVKADSYNIIDPNKEFKPKLFSDALVFEKGEEYSLDDQNISLSRLVNLGTFKFVKNRFDPVDDTLLDVYYYLTPYPKKSIRFQIGASTQNDNRTGTQASLSWRNRNALKGAEELLFKVKGGIEAQASGVSSQRGIYNFGVESDLAFPRFVMPFGQIHTVSRFLPRTIIRLMANYETELNLLSIYSYTASYGYNWKEGLHKEHQLFPINFTYVKTDTLGKPGELKVLYSNLIFDGIILGPTYQYTYNSQIGAVIKSGSYFSGLIDLSGNLIGIAQGANYKTRPQKIFGANYAQYIKLQPDYRYYWHISKSTTLANRVLAGIGIPYGNSSQLPNIKQFWAGGNSDLRGFPSRLVGPGTFNALNNRNGTRFIETLGDLKLELNTEVRQKIYKFLELGLFAEAGNIWLYRKNPDFPGGEFTSNFYKELAADVGFGIRLDFSILLVRLDFGFPVYKPWQTTTVATSSNTQINGMVLNLGIGYPF
jgi:outer membrane protein insertion porin family